MRMFFLQLVITSMIVSCSGQKQDDIILAITNRSNVQIDSVIMPFKEVSILEKINTGETKSITISLEKFNSYNEGTFGMYIYQKGKKRLVHWGLHDFGVLGRKKETFFVFTNGISQRDEALKKPITFSLFLVNKSTNELDSAYVNQSVLQKRSKLSTTLTELQLDFNFFQVEPYLYVLTSGVIKKVKIEHDWENWDNNQEIIYLYDNGIISKDSLQNGLKQ